MSYCTFLPRGCHTVDPDLEKLFGKICGAIAELIHTKVFSYTCRRISFVEMCIKTSISAYYNKIQFYVNSLKLIKPLFYHSRFDILIDEG